MSNAAIAQSDFELIKTDNSAFPETRLLIRTNDLKTVKEDFTISGDSINIDFKFEKTIYKKIDLPKSILFVIDKDLLSENISKDIIRTWTGQLKTSDKINFASMQSISDSLFNINFHSAEFSNDYAFFENISNYNIENKENIDKNFTSTLEKLIDFMWRKEYLSSNKSIIFISDKIIINKIEASAYKKLKERDIQIYFTVNTSSDSITEQNIVELCNNTQGIYRKTEHNNIEKPVKKYLEDISLYKARENSTLYILSFVNTHENNKLLTISYKNNAKTILFKAPKTISYYKHQKLIVILSFSFFALLSLIGLILVAKNRRLKKKIEQINEKIITEKPKNDEIKTGELILQTKGLTKSFTVRKKSILLGRNSDNDFEIPDSTVSGVHAEISTESNKFYIKDLGSTNGTFVNGKKIDFAKIKNNDKIKLGSAFLLFKIN